MTKVTSGLAGEKPGLARAYPEFVTMSAQEPSNVVGRTAHVVVAIPGGERPGEVVVRIRGGSEAYMAFADQPVEMGAQVVVVEDRGARMLVVAPL
ncbi:MAG TPA: hypothetical protein VME46_14925 [Acidimicrobiales bacterium]|nr:hypothetical protein [Acidimicrobiales bacterium]